MTDAPTTIPFPEPLPVTRKGKAWTVVVDDTEVKLSNLDKVFWRSEGYTKADLLAYYHNAAGWILPYLRDRPLTLKRMPDGADGDFFYAKRAPDHTPPWATTARVISREEDPRNPAARTIDYLLAQDRASLLWLANLGCIEFHPWHSRIDDIGRPDYAFFDLDPMDVGFEAVREVALLVRTALDRLGVRNYPRTSGATGMQVYVPLERQHTSEQVREWVGRVCRLINRADPQRTTMEWSVANRTGKVFLDHNMNTEGKNIAATYSLRPERGAPLATPLSWEEVEGGVVPGDFTIETIWERLERVGDLFADVLRGGQDLRESMRALGMDPERSSEPGHDVGRVTGRGVVSPGRSTAGPRLAEYRRRRDFERTPEPATQPEDDTDGSHGDEEAPRFVIQQHLATRLHHDVRLERDGALPSWAVPKGLPDVPGIRRLAVQTEDHPIEYLHFSGDIPEGEYGGGPVRIWDHGSYELLEWQEGKVSVRLRGSRHRGEYHLFRTGGRNDPSQWLVVRRDDPEPGELPGPPPRLRPMLAGEASAPFDDAGWLFEVKWDGLRALATVIRPGVEDDATVVLHSRNGNDITAAYPELRALWERVLARNAVLDGEIVAFDSAGIPSFERLQQRMHVRSPEQIERLRSRIPVVYMVFDLLALDGESLVEQPLADRLACLDGVLIPGAAVQRSEAVPEQGRALYEAAVGRGLEGVIAKHRRSRYLPGRRSRDWLKVKARRSVECVVGGWLGGSGGRGGRLGSLLVGLYDEGELRYMGRVGSGFDEAELQRLEALLADRRQDRSPFSADSDPPRNAHWVSPDLVCRVDYSEVTGARKLRAPSYRGLLPDVDPRRCVVDDVSKLQGR